MIDREKCLEYIKIIETKKQDVQAQIRMMLMQGQIEENQVNIIVELESKKTVDELYL